MSPAQLIIVGMTSVTNKTSYRHRGFTLIEVMLALVIVGLALSMIMTAMDRFTASAQLRDQTLAHWVALNQISEMRLENQWPDVGDTNGTVEFAETEWDWVAEVTETEVPELRRIDVQIFFAEDEVSIAAASGFIGQNRTAPTPPQPWGIPINTGNNGGRGGNSGQPGSNPGQPGAGQSGNVGTGLTTEDDGG